MAKKDDSNVGGYELRKYVAELLGTMALVFFGCASAVLAGKAIGFLGIAFAFGMVVMVMVYALGPISGCHINPAITISMLSAGKISARDAVLYIVVQCIGALIGAELLYMIATGMPDFNLAVNGLGQNGYDARSPGHFTMAAGFVAEVVLTFFFLLVIFGSTSKESPKGFAGVAIGFTLFIVHLVGIPVTGTSVNPARSLGPALLVGGEAVNQLWLFWVAPIIGGLLAAAVWMLVLAPPGPRTDAGEERARNVKATRGGERKRKAGGSEVEDEEEEEEEGEEEKGGGEEEEEGNDK